MSSEPSKTWSHVRLLQAASDGLRTMGDLHSMQKREMRAEREEEEEEEAASLERRKEQKGGDAGQEDSPSSPKLPNTTEDEGTDKERLAEFRRHLQTQFSIKDQAGDPNSDRHLTKLMENLVHGEDDKTSPVSNSESLEEQGTSCTLSGDSHGFPNVDVERTLRRELAVLKEEVLAGIETMKAEVVEELHNLRETFYAYNEHRFLQDLSPLEELDENILDQQRGCHPKAPQGGKLGNSISQEEKYKSRSVPTLHPLHISNRNQAMIRAVNTITAKNSFFSSLSRSNSDPVEPTQAQSIVLPPAVSKSATKKHLKKMGPPAATKTYSSNGKYSGKMSSKVMEPQPPYREREGKPH